MSNEQDESGGDGDADSDSDSDGDADEDPPCIATISGKVQFGNGKPMEDVPFQICAPDCIEVAGNADGEFEVSVFDDGEDTDKSDDRAPDCRYYDFADPQDFIRVTLWQPKTEPVPKETHAEYVVHFEPGESDVSGDNDYDLGKLQLYELPDEGVEYTAETGASVALDGASFELGPGTLEEWVFDSATGAMVLQPVEQATVRVFKVPFDDWNPPFNYFSLDALYYLGPYWTKVKNYGVVLSLDAPDGAPDGATGTLYMLSNASSKGSLAYSAALRHCRWVDSSQNHIAESTLAVCGKVVVQEGKVITPPVPILGWVGFKMDESEESEEEE